MKFLLDENFPKAAHAYLSGLGHATFDLRGTPDEGCDDKRVLERAIAEHAILLTTDRDFFHTIGAETPNHPGIVVVALKQPNRERILDRLDWIINHFTPDVFPGRVFQLRDRTWLAYPEIE